MKIWQHCDFRSLVLYSPCLRLVPWSNTDQRRYEWQIVLWKELSKSPKHPWNIHETSMKHPWNCSLPSLPSFLPPNSAGSKFTTQLPRTCHESRGTSRTPKAGIIVLNGTWTPRDRPVELQDLRLRAIVRWINILSGLAVGSTPCLTVAQLDKQMKFKG